MKRLYTVIAMIVLVGSISAAAKAQTSGRAQLIASIPFEFTVGEKTLPAGVYRLQAVNNSVVRIQSEDGKTSAMAQSMNVAGKAQDDAKLIFHRYGNRYFFAQAWVGGGNEGLQVQQPRAERAMQRELAELKKAGGTVAIAAARR